MYWTLSGNDWGATQTCVLYMFWYMFFSKHGNNNKEKTRKCNKQKNPPTPRRVGTWPSMERKERAKVVCCLRSFCLVSYLCVVMSFCKSSFVSLRELLKAVYVLVYLSISFCRSVGLFVRVFVCSLFACLTVFLSVSLFFFFPFACLSCPSHRCVLEASWSAFGDHLRVLFEVQKAI